MANFSNTSYLLGYQKALTVYQAFTANSALSTVGYIMLGKPTTWDGSDTVPATHDTEDTQFQTYNNFLGGKRITGNDVFLVIKRVNWSTGVTYTPYDDASNTQFTSANSMYVYVGTGEVYKCISNANNIPSTVAPTGNYSNNNGFIGTGDGYVWKYMYKVPSGSKFLTTSWLPVPTTQNAAYFGHANNVVTGAISRVIVLTAGSGYFNVNTSIVFTGSGVAGNANAVISGSGTLQSVTLDSRGTRYIRRHANTTVVGKGTGATVRTILSPYGGHAINPAAELGANTVMISVKVGDVDATEGGNLTANNDFRQIGLLMRPHKYGETEAVTSDSADIAVTMTTKLVLVTGAAYTYDEQVYQGVSLAAATFTANVSDVFTNSVELVNTQGTITLGVALVGVTSAISRAVLSSTPPDLDTESGDLVYTENRAPVVRGLGQAELVKVVLRF